MKKRQMKVQGGLVEALGDGQQFVAAGTHSSGVPYVWEGGLPSQLPSLTPSQMDGLWAHLSQKFSISPATDVGIQSSARTSNDAEDPVRTEMIDAEWDDLISALRHILRGDYASTNDGWSEIGYALLSIQHTRPARQLWLDFSRKAPNYEPDKPEQWWSAHADQIPRSDFRHVFSIARAEGWGKTVSAETFAPIDVAQTPVVQVPVVDGSECVPLPYPPPETGRPTIRIISGNLPLCIEQCTAVLKNEVYVSGGKIVVEATPPETWRAVSPSWLSVRLTELTVWESWDGRMKDWKGIDCPDKLAEKYCKLGVWPGLRPLDAVMSAPFMREDGSICDVEGYDAASRAIYRPNAAFPAVPVSPTKVDAEAALALLLAPFDEFPFVTENSRAAFVAHILTETARLALDVSPMFWYTAALFGTGKSLLSDMPSAIVHGRPPARRPWPRAEDELRKTLLSSMLGGDRSMTFDNVPNGHKVRTAELCAAITSEWWQDRKLGVSETPLVRNRLVISASGNNVTPTADMARRSLVIRIVPPSDIKDKRYKITDLRAYIAQHRAELLIAALTILRAYQLHGMNARDYPVALQTFDRWSRVVRNPLLWLGLPDPSATQNEETDDETDGLENVFGIMGPIFNGVPLFSTDVAKAAGHNDALNDALTAAGCDEPYSPKKIGYWLRENRDRRGGDWRLSRGRKTARGRPWMLVSLNKSNEDLA